MQAATLLVAQILEVVASLILLKLTSKPQYKFVDLFKPDESSKERNWFLASAIGFGVLFALVVITSFVLERFIEPKVGLINFSSLEASFSSSDKSCSKSMPFRVNNTVNS